jgi:hypothetical protein
MKSARLKNQPSACRGDRLVIHHRNFLFQPLHGTAAKGGMGEPNLLANGRHQPDFQAQSMDVN